MSSFTTDTLPHAYTGLKSAAFGMAEWSIGMLALRLVLSCCRPTRCDSIGWYNQHILFDVVISCHYIKEDELVFSINAIKPRV